MNLAHVHLILNHIPVVGVPLALLFFVHAVYLKNLSSQRFALSILVGLAVVALPVYFTGEPAEELIEHLPGFSESFIAPHENAALFSLVLTLITGATALLTLVFQRDAKMNRMLKTAVIFFGCLTVIGLLYTANLGGKVRHTELRSTSEVRN